MAYAGDLKSPDAHASCGFDPHPGHQVSAKSRAEVPLDTASRPNAELASSLKCVEIPLELRQKQIEAQAGPRRFLTLSTRFAIPSGLESTASTPTAEASAFPIFSPCTENKIIGRCGVERFMIDATSAPFIRGIAKSKRTRSGLSSFTFSIASTPSVASPQTSNSVCISRYVRIRDRTPALSSAMRILFGIITLTAVVLKGSG